MSTQWTEEQDNELIDLYGSNLSFGFIARRLGRTRNAVAGRARRLKLIRPDKVHATLQQQVEDLRGRGWSFSKIEEKLGQKIDLSIKDVINSRHREFSFKQPKNKKKPILYFSKVDLVFTKTLAELGPNDCRFPQGDGPFYFCGEKTDGQGPYCSRCRSIAYQISSKSNKRNGEIKQDVA